MAITKEQIHSAADELDAAGKSPTLAEVRKLVGGGSFTTISEAMTEWKARRSAQPSVIRDPAPPAVVEKLTEFGAEVWAAAMELANTRLATEREALDGARGEMEAARAEAAELADQLTAELDESKAQVLVLGGANAKLTDEIGVLRASVSALTERAATAEARVDELRREIEHAHGEVDQIRQERNSAIELASTRANQVEKMGSDLAAADARSEGVARRLEEVEVALDRERATAEKFRSERDGALSSVRTSDDLLKQLRAQFEREQELHEKTRLALDASRGSAATLAGKIQALEELAGLRSGEKKASQAKKHERDN